MKKGMKKFVAGTLAIALAASSLTGCGSSAVGADVIQGADDTAGGQETDTGKDTGQETNADKDADSETGQETDTVQWFNASYAILTYANGQDYNMFGGAEPSMIMEAQYQAMLDSSWGVTDRASADENLDWILTEGHRTDFAEESKQLVEAGLEELEEEDYADFLMEAYDFSEEDAAYAASVYKMYKEYGETAIDGWDYCRAMSLLSFYYMAGYYTKEEALDKSLEIATTLQPMFHSWDELIDSYLRGYEYWAQEDSTERREIYEDLLAADDNPFRVDYNTTLEKTW